MAQEDGSKVFLVLALLCAAGVVVTYYWSQDPGLFQGEEEAASVESGSQERAPAPAPPPSPGSSPSSRSSSPGLAPSSPAPSSREAQRERMRREEEAMRARLREDGRAPAEWMAQPEDVDQEAMERRLDQGEMERDFELARREDARVGAEMLEESVQLCMALLSHRSEAFGDEVGLRWRLRTEAGQGWVEAVEAVAGAGLDDGFRECVTATTMDLTFEAQGDGVDTTVTTRVSLRRL